MIHGITSRRAHWALGALVAVTLMSACAPDLPDPESPAALLYRDRCSGCHRLYHPGLMTADMWTVQVDRMQREFQRRGMPPLSTVEVGTILGYLRAHSLGTTGTSSAPPQ